jgi:hypothetical protein
MAAIRRGGTLPGERRRSMGALWIAVTFAYVLFGIVIVLGGGWRMFHPHK